MKKGYLVFPYFDATYNDETKEVICNWGSFKHFLFMFVLPFCHYVSVKEDK